MTIKLQRQGPMECWPTTVCMLTGHDWPTLRREVEKGYGGPYVIVRSGPRGTEMKNFIIRKTNADPRLLSSAWAHGVTIKRGRAPRMKIPVRGRGMLLIVKRVRMKDTDLIAHVVAYENGLVYDPERLTPMDETAFNETYRGWRVETRIPLVAR